MTIPNTVTYIGKNAFLGCLNFDGGLTISNKVTTIEEYAFASCIGLTGDLIIPNSVTTIGSEAFWNCYGFTGDLIIPNSVTSIGGYAFMNCSGFTGDLTISNKVTTIGEYAFSGCIGLTGALIIPESVTSIGSYAFNSCGGLTGKLTIPESVTSIGLYAFCDCSGLSGIICKRAIPPTLGADAFKNVSCEIIVPCGKAEVYKAADDWKDLTNTFRDKFTAAAKSCDETFGTVSVSEYDCSNDPVFTATANDGYKFVKWSDGNQEASYAVTLDKDTVITAIFEKEETTGINETVSADAFSVYPNPAKNVLYINCASEEAEEIKIYNIKGELIKTSVINSGEAIDVSTLVPAMYIIKTDKNTVQFIKQ